MSKHYLVTEEKLMGLVLLAQQQGYLATPDGILGKWKEEAEPATNSMTIACPKCSGVADVSEEDCYFQDCEYEARCNSCGHEFEVLAEVRIGFYVPVYRGVSADVQVSTPSEDS
jgi:DNA-directed RNA polymerase subunit RPC12/RpoP